MKKNRIAMGILAGTLMLAGVLFTASPAQAQSRFSIGIGVGPGYYAPPPVVYRPPYPGPGYYWTDGYYDPYGAWIAGFWGPRAYVRPFGYGYAAPRYYGGGYSGGYRRDFGQNNFRGGRGGDRGRGNGRR